MNSKRTLFLVEVAIFTALALLLDILPISFKIWAQGGSVSFAMIPVFIVAFRWGIKGGLLSGFLWGVLQVATGTAYVLEPLQGFIDYAIAFTVLGFAGLFAKKIQEAVKSGESKTYLTYITLGVFVGSALRFVAHYVAGIVFFGSAVEGQPAWLYSLIYNASYMVPSFIISTVIVFFLFHKQPRTLLNAA
ncbi:MULTISPECIES: energy-coupled thiamine transporter ThiT [Oceanobacillus]|uniref:Energy-coupled thiamine transporter ThiT n=1 Tax=Oceanobacillus profundus TaxID=372463 RepID=A0A417YKJ8_9BACI|nr:energy-coupled thiamine transporter ThiT [Oceanobacillus profundus]MBR3120441.1 energy-coupled thiamine transporter ThiT [Oceanobacillus sp.]PAE30212.1 energy-coupled thiamine transporter ThiT [Paenibacillus sp. 7884-2]MCM3397067.1 energy-coupled thiamine transporter ThiT [Oceanobacillus profundus]MDO6449843.1 energy-coupled thiamine transporter ThiT [Oceanobacillus profundus]RHW33837.1 energy-coupled thiamine transporter ThiT [Oceanobacillus profundus]